MHRLGLLLAIFLAAWLVGCQREQPAPQKAGDADPGVNKPFLVKTNAGFSTGPPVFALIKVPELPGKDLSKIRFETTFKTKEGQVIEKHWTGGEDRKRQKHGCILRTAFDC